MTAAGPDVPVVGRALVVAAEVDALQAKLDTPRNYPGPWFAREPSDDEFDHVGLACIVQNEDGKGDVTDWLDPDVAHFIAAAFNGWDTLVAGLREAAGQVETLRAEVERLRSIESNARTFAALTPCTCSAQRSRAESAEAERDRLRAENARLQQQVDAVRGMADEMLESSHTEDEGICTYDGVPMDECSVWLIRHRALAASSPAPDAEPTDHDEGTR